MFLAALAVASAACSPATPLQPSTVVASQPSEAVLLSYSLEPGFTFSYEVELNQHLEMSASGDASAMGDEEFPGQAVIDLEGSAVFTYTVVAGTEPGTYEINIQGAFEKLEVTGTIDGESVDEVPDFATLDPVDVTVVVDDRGNLIVEGLDIDNPFGSLFGDLGGLGSANAPGLDPGQFFGPAFSTDEVRVGDSWSEEIETEGFGGKPIVTNVRSTITAADQVAGSDVFVIETTTTTSLIELDLSEFFLGMLGSFIPNQAGDGGSAEIDALMEHLKFVITIDGSRSESTVWFDPGAGVVRKFLTDAGSNLMMSVNIPDEVTGELVGFDMELSISQQISYRLLDSPSA